MNKINAEVKKILRGPYYRTIDNQSWWAVDVKLVDTSGISRKTLIFNKKEKAEEIEEGFKFTH